MKYVNKDTVKWGLALFTITGASSALILANGTPVHYALMPVGLMTGAMAVVTGANISNQIKEEKQKTLKK